MGEWYNVCIRTQVRISYETWPEPSEVPSGCALGNFLGLRPYFIGYPSSRPNTDTIYKDNCWNVVIICHLVTKTLFLLKNDPNRLYGGEKLPFISIFRPFWGPISCPRDPNRVQNRFSYIKMIVGTWRSTHVIFNLVKNSLFLVKNVTEKKK